MLLKFNSIMSPEIEPRREQIPSPTHIVEARFLEIEPDPNKVKYITNQLDLKPVISDEAHFPGGNTTEMYKFSDNSGTAEVSGIVQLCAKEDKNIVPIGTQTSLTGGAVPKGEVVLDMANRKWMSEIEHNEDGYFITVHSGVTLDELQENIREEGLFLPSAPTYPGATVIGAISTDAKGARSYKYGPMRNFVEELEVVLSTGEVLEMKRGQYIAHPGNKEYPAGYFELKVQDEDEPRLIPVPTYQMPDVSKVSAGYYAKPGMDLIDLFAGSEGTLGVITEAKIKVMEEPPTMMALVPCDSDEQALKLIARLWGQESEKRETLEPGGISAVEYIGSSAVNLLKEHGKTIPRGAGAEDAKAFLLVQVEDVADSVEAFINNFSEERIADFLPAHPDPDIMPEKDYHDKTEGFTNFRESVPLTVNEQIAALKVTKVGADPCVKPEKLKQMIAIYDEESDRAGIKRPIYWGHGEGNLHPNFLPENEEEVKLAMRVVLKAGERVMAELHGTATAEHGIGRNEIKKALVLAQHGRQGIKEMYAVKQAVDPYGRLAPGNIFSLAA
jgi:D-lactate dehydrogenase (cytochrome)